MKKSELKARVEELEKELASEKQSHKYAVDSKKDLEEKRNAAQTRLDSLHAVFDALPGVIPKETEVEEQWGGTHKQPTTVEARFISYMATLITK